MTGVAGSGSNHGPSHGAGHDPARAWATEHYGFADEVDPAQPFASAVVRADPIRSLTPSGPRGVRLAVAGVLASVLVAGFGGAAIAAGVVDGPVDGPGGFAGGGPGDGDGGPGGGGGGR